MTQEPQTTLETSIYNQSDRRPDSVPLLLIDDTDVPMDDYPVKTCIDYAISRSTKAVHPTTLDGDHDDPNATHATAAFPPRPNSERGIRPVRSIPASATYPISSNAVIKIKLALPIIVYGDTPSDALILYQPDLVSSIPEPDIADLIYMAFQRTVNEYDFHTYDELKEAQAELTYQAGLLAKAIHGEPEVAFLQALTDHVNTFQTSIPWPARQAKVTVLNGAVAITVNPAS